jgi:hypothetical protein
MKKILTENLTLTSIPKPNGIVREIDRFALTFDISDGYGVITQQKNEAVSLPAKSSRVSLKNQFMLTFIEALVAVRCLFQVKRHWNGQGE